jgi:quercetin dioxygenase-like cupin family protein
VLHGKKSFTVDGLDHVVNEGEVLHIPANVEHCATNKYASVMLSIGD